MTRTYVIATVGIVVLLAGGGIWYYLSSSPTVPSPSSTVTTSTVPMASSTVISAATASTTAVCDQKAVATDASNMFAAQNAKLGLKDSLFLKLFEEGGVSVGTEDDYSVIQNDGQAYYFINHRSYVVPPASQISIYKATSTNVLDGTAKPQVLQIVPNSVNTGVMSFDFADGLLLYVLLDKAGVQTTYAINAQTGDSVWSRSNTVIANASSTGIYAFEAASTTSPGTYTGLMRLNPSNGTPLWSIPITGGISLYYGTAFQKSVRPFGTTLYLIRNDFTASGTGTANLLSIDPASGKTLWTYSAIGDLNPFFALDSNLYVDQEVGPFGSVAEHQSVITLSEATGKVVATSEFPPTRTVSMASISDLGVDPVVCGGNIYFTADDSGLAGYSETDKLDVSTGKITVLEWDANGKG